MKIPFSPPYIDDAVLQEVHDTLCSGWITTGPKVHELEREMTAFTGCQRSLCVNSWTSGAILTLKWLGIKEGDEVIIPAYTYAATALAVIHAGGTPVMVDVLDDLTMDPQAVAQALSSRTKAIIPVDALGLMCDYNRLFQVICSPEALRLFSADSSVQQQLGRVLILADAAHSMGATYRGKVAGTCADITIFSFHAVKNVTTAEGGAICLQLPEPFDADAVYGLMRLWSLNGQTKDAYTKSSGNGWRYDIILEGLKCNMPDICAAIGLAQLRQYQRHLLPSRKNIAQRYSEFFYTRPWAELPILEDNQRECSYHLYTLRIKGITEADRDAIIDRVLAQGVGVNVHFIPLPMLTAFRRRGANIIDFPNAYFHYSREISLPIYPQLTAEQIDQICRTVEEAYLAIGTSEKVS